MIKAKLQHLRISPRKVRLVANLIKGLSVAEAEKQLSFLNKRAAGPVLKLLKSAVANVKNSNSKIEKENLFISNITVDAGPVLKRMWPRAMGRADVIKKRTSHVTISIGIKAGSEPIKAEKTAPKIKETSSLIPGEKEMPELQKVGEKEIKQDVAAGKPKSVSPARPYPTTPKSKKRFFSRQTFGNAKKIFRRKSI